MLSWSVEETNQTLDLAAITDPSANPLVVGSRQLADLGLAAVGTGIDSSRASAIREVLGPTAGVDAAAVAGAFEYYNRIVDATGVPVSKPTRAQKEQRTSIIAALDLAQFPHATL